MTSRLALDTEAVEARLADRLSTGTGWQFDPKRDGFSRLASVFNGAARAYRAIVLRGSGG